MAQNNQSPLNASGIPLCKLKGICINLSQFATPCRFRFFDCDQFVNQHSLYIVEFKEKPAEKYSAISYPWQGLSATTDPSLGWFSVKGAEAGGSLSIDVLMTSCRASLIKGCRLLWLDRLSIMQTNREDKNWQIKEMYSIYKDCSHCLILPGGLARLASLEEQTTWASRAWTLQEALVPKDAHFVFFWKYKENEIISFEAGTRVWDTCIFTIIEPEHSAMVDFSEMTSLGVTQFKTKIYENQQLKTFETKINLVGHQEMKCLAILSDYMFGKVDMHRKYCGKPGLRNTLLWKCVWMRTSSRPVDMVFSVMGLFGVQLDPSAFSQADRYKATTALMREILRNGGHADWLGVSLKVGPSPVVSNIPAIPETTVCGTVLLRSKDGRSHDVADKMGSLEIYLKCPKGRIDEEGYLTLFCRAAPVKKTTRIIKKPRIIRFSIANNGVYDGSGSHLDLPGGWETASLEQSAGMYAIEVGTTDHVDMTEIGCYYQNHPHVLMIVQKNRHDNKFHTVCFTWTNFFDGRWENRELTIGGPMDENSKMLAHEWFTNDTSNMDGMHSCFDTSG